SPFLLLLAIAPILGLLAISLFYHIWDPLTVAIALSIFFLYLYRTTYYTIDGEMLHIRSGFMINTHIEIDRIKSIAETNSILSGPALSLDRIEIFYNKYDSVMISPPDKVQFVADLQAINPNITIAWKIKKWSKK
ncbi:MAG TPA: PH domain-containing protein, partial [Mucilaginibacter sp.]|nr:PH domain-containing protein [Mucilaginibacter sp.]